MPGVFPSDPTPNTTYLEEIESIVDTLWEQVCSCMMNQSFRRQRTDDLPFNHQGIASIIDLHQDILSPLICGEGTPDWMVRTSDAQARERK